MPFISIETFKQYVRKWIRRKAAKTKYTDCVHGNIKKHIHKAENKRGERQTIDHVFQCFQIHRYVQKASVRSNIKKQNANNFTLYI